MDTITPIFQVYAKRKTSKQKLARIYLRIIYQKDSLDRSTGITCDVRQWNAETISIKNDPHLTHQLKDHVEVIKHKVLGAYYILKQTSPEISLLEIISVALDGERSKIFSVYSCFQSVIDKMNAASGNDGASAANIQKHNVVFRHLKTFVEQQYGWRDFPFSRINKSFIDGFVEYLKTRAGCAHNTTMKHLAIFKKIYKIAVDNLWVKTNAFAGVRMGMKPVRRTILTEDEINIIAEKRLTTSRLDFVRDIFIFACFTGLAYIDIVNLKRRNVVDNLRISWIKMPRTKTGVDSTIPLLDPARHVLDKWSTGWEKLSGDSNFFKMLSNQKTNAYLKEIAAICGIEKEISFHLARHSFATSIALCNNIPLETVSKMLGHSRVSMTQHYSKVIDIKIAKDSGFLMSKYSGVKTPS